MKFALTTKDNPFNPFKEFDLWFGFDESKGYNCSGLVARVAGTTIELTDGDNDRVIEDAIDFIIESHPGGAYKKLSKN